MKLLSYGKQFLGCSLALFGAVRLGPSVEHPVFSGGVIDDEGKCFNLLNLDWQFSAGKDCGLRDTDFHVLFLFGIDEVNATINRMSLISETVINEGSGYNADQSSNRENVEKCGIGGDQRNVELRHIARALLEAMDRIDALEAEIAELKQKI